MNTAALTVTTALRYCILVSTTPAATHLVGITKQKDSLQSFDTQWFQGSGVELHQGLGWVDHRLDSIVEDVRNGLLLLG